MSLSLQTVRGVLPFAAVVIFFTVTLAAEAQWSGRDGWVEEPGTKSLNVGQKQGHAYLDPASIYRGDDGLIYFNESADVSRAEDIGKVGFMKDAFDCAKNIKYMCVEHENWRTDVNSAIDASKDPAFRVYRQYLCGDAKAAGDSSAPASDAATDKRASDPNGRLN